MTDAAASILRDLEHRGATVATAESITGGRLAARFTAVPGSSAAYVGGVVSYATALKESLLGVPPELVAAHGVVSGECARAMAGGVRALTGATWGISTTGVAGPGAQDSVPAGTAYVAVVGPTREGVVALELTGRRDQVQERTCEEALSALAAILDEEG